MNEVITELRRAAEERPLPLALRLERLRSLRRFLDENQTRFATALKQDLGKSFFESWTAEIGFLMKELRHLIAELPRLADPQPIETPWQLLPGQSMIYREPYGLVLIMAPWNYPLQLTLSPLAGAIAAGNRVVVKPSEMAPNCATLIAECVEQVFGKDEVRVVQGGVSETQALLKERFDYIFFTGSSSVGKVVLQAAAEHLTPVTLELGGKSPCLLDGSTDLSLTAKRIAWGKWMNAGQTCVAPDYVLVPKAQSERLAHELQKAVAGFYGPDPRLSPDYGRIINHRHFDRLVQLLKHSNVVWGGDYDRSQRYLAPTVISCSGFHESIMSEEIFGPLLPIIGYETLTEALRLIRSRSKPLAFYLFSQLTEVQERVLQEVSFGGGCVNDTLVHLANTHLPFGGVGESGMGTYHGSHSFETFSHRKSIYRQSTFVDLPVRYPPYEGKEKLIKFLIK